MRYHSGTGPILAAWHADSQLQPAWVSEHPGLKAVCLADVLGGLMYGPQGSRPQAVLMWTWTGSYY